MKPEEARILYDQFEIDTYNLGWDDAIENLSENAWDPVLEYLIEVYDNSYRLGDNPDEGIRDKFREKCISLIETYLLDESFKEKEDEDAGY